MLRVSRSNSRHSYLRFNDPSQLQQGYAPRPNHGDMANQQSTGGRWDAILADRQTVSYGSSGNGNPPQRGGNSFSGNYGNRNMRDNGGGGGYGGQRDNNRGRRDQESHRPFHSHVGGQSGDTTGADWSSPLPPNPSLERCVHMSVNYSSLVCLLEFVGNCSAITRRASISISTMIFRWNHLIWTIHR